ncbi:hypothetical protein SDC9_117254 [bioreactor metagenome]|uniref:Uncharacterized protein n=1 Tax=bioreactor metagenome TaxID=1076179 RepID=A0A645BY49_9ZZZZ
MRRDARPFHALHEIVGHLIVDDALANNGAFFRPVESGGVILVIHNVALGVVGFEHLFGLALVNLFQLLHIVFLPKLFLVIYY